MAAKCGPIGILSIGDMGGGIARLLIDHKYKVATYAGDRSQATQERARTAGIELSPSIEAFVDHCDYILSIVPPRDAYRTAERVATAMSAGQNSRTRRLYYLDLNAIAPGTARDIEKLLHSVDHIRLLDGGIIGGVPYLKPSEDSSPNWHCPSLIVSGPHRVPDSALSKVLNIRHIADIIGPATGLKMCYAVTTKGFNALAIESFTTAYKIGVMDELQKYLAEYNAPTLRLAEKGITTMPPKAYRWVGEMMEIAKTMNEDGGFDSTLFEGVSEVYRVVAEDTVLGEENPDKRTRGKTVEDAVRLISQGMDSAKDSG